MNTISRFGLAIALLAAFSITSCDEDDPIEEPIIPNEEEVITTLELHMTPAGGGEEVVYTYRDLDADGPMAPAFAYDGVLQANTAYVGQLTLLNETVAPADTVNIEIMEEDDEHQFFFAIEDADLAMIYADVDGNGDPLGLQTSIIVGDASSGTLTVILRHEPNKEGEGVSDGDISEAGGETDIEVTFDVEIE